MKTIDRSIKMPKLYARFAPVSAGKSTRLLVEAYAYGDKAEVWKPEVDTRTAPIFSRVPGLSRDADATIGEHTRPLPKETTEILFVDEAHFLSAADVDYLASLTENIPVICYGLRTDWRGNGFPGSIRLFELADQWEEIKQVCAVDGCGRRATMNKRVGGDPQGPSIQLGFEDVFIPVCRHHFRLRD